MELISPREMAQAIIEASKHNQKEPIDPAYTTQITREVDWRDEAIVCAQRDKDRGGAMKQVQELANPYDERAKHDLIAARSCTAFDQAKAAIYAILTGEG